jgi:3-oxoacyl-[acyl-carrier protein] reductase
MKNLNGKVAVVTGSGQGIGRAIAMAMAAEGAKLVTNNRPPDSLL